MADGMTVRYYRASTPETRAAWAEYAQQNVGIVAEAKAFAARFDGATPVYRSAGTSRGFYGLKFEPKMPTDIWTIPSESNGYTQAPRARISAKTSVGKAERVAELRRVQAIYAAHRPTSSTRIIPVFDALGTDWGTLLLCGYQLVERNGTIYLATAAEIGSPCEEIAGSAFDAALKEVDHG
jgi:hypothetical protein